MNGLRPRPRRLAPALAALAVLAGAAGCSVGEARAAVTVDGVAISRSTVEDLVAANARFYEQQIQEGQDTTGELAALLEGAQGVGEATVGMDGARDAIETLVTYQVIRAELERRDAVPDRAAIVELRTELETQVGGADELERFDADFIAYTVESRALIRAYQDELAADARAEADDVDPAEREQELRALYDQVAPTQPLCLNVILVDTEAEAADALARVEAGEDFGDVAAEVSTEPSSAAQGGFAGCAPVEQADEAFGVSLADEPVGALAGPTPYDTGGPEPSFAVLQVESVDGPTYEQLLPRLEATLDEAAVVDPADIDVAAAIAELLLAAEIEVDPRFGTWNQEAGRVEPPDAASSDAPAVPAESAGN